MTVDEIKDTLRDGVRARILHGWYRHVPMFGKEWVVAPRDGDCARFSHAEVVEYCGMLREALG